MGARANTGNEWPTTVVGVFRKLFGELGEWPDEAARERAMAPLDECVASGRSVPEDELVKRIHHRLSEDLSLIHISEPTRH